MSAPLQQGTVNFSWFGSAGYLCSAVIATVSTFTPGPIVVETEIDCR